MQFQLTILFSAILLISASVSKDIPGNHHPTCDQYHWGVFCTPDLTGYVKCGGTWETGPILVEHVECPVNTRCSCFHGNDCDKVTNADGSIGVREKNICQPLAKSFPLKEIMHLRYSKKGWQEVDPSIDEVMLYDDVGEVKQDIRQRKLMKTWRSFGIDDLNFQLVLPIDENTYIEYNGRYPDRCEHTITHKWQPVANDIEYYRLGDMRNATEVEQQVQQRQVWYNTKYRYEGQSQKTQWTVKSDIVARHVVPESYDSQHWNSVEEPCCAEHIATDFQEVKFDPGQTNTDDWFRVPSFCVTLPFSVTVPK